MSLQWIEKQKKSQMKVTPKRKIEEEVVDVEERVERPRKIQRVVYEEPHYDQAVLHSIHNQLEVLSQKSDKRDLMLDELIHGEVEKSKASGAYDLMDTIKSALGNLLGSFSVPAILFIIDLYSKRASKATENQTTATRTDVPSNPNSNINYSPLFK